MSNKLLTIISPVFNIDSNFFDIFIKSIETLNRGQYDVILVDDGSDKECRNKCDEYANEYENIKVIHKMNGGVSSARNAGIDLAKTPFITFADPDDWYDNGAIDKLLNLLNENDADALLFGYNREFKTSVFESLDFSTGYIDDRYIDDLKKAPFYKLFINDKLVPFSMNAVWNKVYKMDILIEHNIRFDESISIGEDRVFNAEYFQFVEKTYYLNDLIYHYRRYANSTVGIFKPNIIEETIHEINGLSRVIKKHNLGNFYNDLTNLRACTRIYICMRLCLFNKKNPNYKNRYRDLNSLVNNEFSEALMNADTKKLSKSERLFVKSIKKKHYRIAAFLMKIKDRKDRKKLNGE